MYGLFGLSGQEYLLILLAVTIAALPIVAILIVVIRAFRDRGNQSRHT